MNAVSLVLEGTSFGDGALCLLPLVCLLYFLQISGASLLYSAHYSFEIAQEAFDFHSNRGDDGGSLCKFCLSTVDLARVLLFGREGSLGGTNLIKLRLLGALFVHVGGVVLHGAHERSRFDLELAGLSSVHFDFSRFL